MKKNLGFLLLVILTFCPGYSQVNTDSILSIPVVTVNAYPSKPLLLNAASSVSIINPELINNYNDQTLVPVLNSVAGMRMEERSPGSYRLSIRGSLLRSPFGIRNIKIYMDEFPLTDAGGNTYLNLIDLNSINTVQVIKGPEGSLFGANTGGVVMLGMENNHDSSTFEAILSTGSFGLLNEHTSINKKWTNYSIKINQAFQKSNGYRENSALQRNYLQAFQKWNFRKGNIKLFLLGSKIHYETPGGLTLAQSEENPRQSRPATSTLPGAIEQEAGIYNSTFYCGISNDIYFFNKLKLVTTLFGSITDFKNPFITNYETKKEKTSGLRTYLDLTKKTGLLVWNWDFGIEWQQTKSSVANNDNNAGNKGKIQAADDLSALQSFIFSQFSTLINTRFKIEAALSLNNYKYRFKNSYPNNENNYTLEKLNLELMPRIGISFRIIDNFVWRASVSKGYSPPTLAEIRPSDNNIYNGLQSEVGWNYETGFRLISSDRRWDADLVTFEFDLKDAIVRRTDSIGNEYFVNAGSTSQKGLEFQFGGKLVKNRSIGLLRGLEYRTALTYYHFIFSDYSYDVTSYSGNKITGVPEFVNVSSLKIYFPQKIDVFISYNYTSKIPLNDANSFYSEPYNLLGFKLSWEHEVKHRMSIILYAGIDNILNTSYSLGNDINAAGNRFYNPALKRNFYFGIQGRF